MKVVPISYQPRNEQELKRCLKSRAWRLANLYHIMDERGRDVVFRPNLVQRQFRRDIWYLNIVLKSRQHGITTDRCIAALDYALFTPNIRAGIIAHNREDAEAFFRDKIKYAYDRLPESLRAARPADSNTARELMFSNNSAIRVGTSMRSATLQYLHISEFGKICKKYPDKAREIVTGSLNTLHVGQQCTIESTAEGREGYFYDFCQEAQKKQARGSKLTPLDFRFHFFPWYLDPRNALDPTDVTIPAPLLDYFERLRDKSNIDLSPAQQAWYYKKWSMDGEGMKREHPSTPDEAFEATIEGSYYARQFERIYAEHRICRVPIESLPVYTFWDLGMDDATAIWFMQRVGVEWRAVDYYEASGEGLDHYALVLQQRGYLYGEHWGPHDLTVRELSTGKSRAERARELGINFNIVPRPADVLAGIEAVRAILPRCWFDEERCQRGISALENYRKEWDDRNGVYRSRPLHDWASHGADAFRTFAAAEAMLGSGQSMSDAAARQMFERYAPPPMGM